VGVQNGPSNAPDGWVSDYKIVNRPSFVDGVSAISTLIFACSATPAYFSIVAEMRDPRYFTRSLLISQAISTIVYLIIGVVVYYYCGSMVASPALGSAGHLIKRISYGIALPSLVASTTIFMHVSISTCFSLAIRLIATLMFDRIQIIVPFQVSLCSLFTRIEAFNIEFLHSLGHMVWVHFWMYHDLIRHCKWCSSLQ
jgi:amino acid permease